MVPGAGLEPARCYQRGILNPLCLPIPPPGHRVARKSMWSIIWRRNPESNRGRRICNPLHGHSAIPPSMIGASNEVRTRDLNLGKVALYQLSYTRIIEHCL